MSTKKKAAPKDSKKVLELCEEVRVLREENAELLVKTGALETRLSAATEQYKGDKEKIETLKQWVRDLSSRHGVMLMGLTRIARIASGEMAAVQSRGEAIETLRRISDMPLRSEDRILDVVHIDTCFKRPSMNR